MKSIDILDRQWIDIVFEGRNKAYGAYDLRLRSAQTMFYAFCCGMLFLASVVTIPILLHNLTKSNTPPPFVEEFDKVIRVDNYYVPPVEVELPPAQTAPLTEELPVQLINPTVAEAAQAEQNIATNAQNQPDPIDAVLGNGTAVTAPINAPVGSGTVTTSPPPTSPVPPNVLDRIPEFPGGIDKFREYVGRNFEKPELESASAVRLVVLFVIEKDGTMTNIRVHRDPGQGLGKEAVRVLKSIKSKWKPGILRGQPVATAYTLPIVIQLE